MAIGTTRLINTDEFFTIRAKNRPFFSLIHSVFGIQFQSFKRDCHAFAMIGSEFNDCKDKVNFYYCIDPCCKCQSLSFLMEGLDSKREEGI